MRSPENNARGLGGHRPEGKQQQQHGDLNTAPRKSGRTRYIRLFPERLDFLLSRLDPQGLAAYLRITVEYVVRDGDLAGDDRTLARIAQLRPAAWAALRDNLQALGIAEVTDGRWRDGDQDKNLEVQRATAERQRARALRRWRLRAVP